MESSLRDHGVRKYDEETGRFTSCDALWQKYLGLTPYQYSFNDPVNFKDLDGKDVLVVYRGFWATKLDDPGHISMAVVPSYSNASNNYRTIQSSWSFSPKNKTDYDGILIKGTPGGQEDIRWDMTEASSILRIKTSQEFDNTLSGLIQAREGKKENYHIRTNNCASTLIGLFQSALNKMNCGINLGDGKMDFLGIKLPICTPGSVFDVLKYFKNKIEQKTVNQTNK